MKKAVFILFVLLLPQVSTATLLAVDFTGATAQLFDTPGYLDSAHGGGTQAFFGGPAAMNIEGHAYQFSVTTKIFVHNALIDFDLTDLSDVFCDASSDPSCPNAFSSFRLVLYGKTLHHEYWGIVPNRESELVRSGGTVLNGPGQYLDVLTASVDFWLNPGLYWVGIEGEGERTYFFNVRLQGSYIEVPEPASYLLLCFGLPLLHWTKKKVGL